MGEAQISTRQLWDYLSGQPVDAACFSEGQWVEILFWQHLGWMYCVLLLCSFYFNWFSPDKWHKISCLIQDSSQYSTWFYDAGIRFPVLCQISSSCNLFTSIFKTVSSMPIMMSTAVTIMFFFSSSMLRSRYFPAFHFLSVSRHGLLK